MATLGATVADAAPPAEDVPAGDDPFAEPPTKDNEYRVVVLLAVAAIVGALIGGRAALLNDRGGDQLTDAINADVRSGARIVGDVRQLYEEDASVAHRVAELELLGEELAAVASEQTDAEATAILRGDAEANTAAAALLADTSSLLEGDGQAALDLTGVDLLERLGEIRDERSAELQALDPDALQAEAEDQLQASSRLMALLVVVALAFLFGALAEVLDRSHRLLLAGGYACLVVAGGAALLIEASL